MSSSDAATTKAFAVCIGVKDKYRPNISSTNIHEFLPSKVTGHTSERCPISGGKTAGIFSE